ncbi:hypothetical protein F5879DRAFT_792806 [Lentinula edodes]|nr:hypothetical protein GG344DRAFT_52994 [Lentinula edodes]KAJ3908809.1 hypothetical protein F5879DRAFT_792806 [Lentinula edodes]KAJ3911212.1 hypothetical protein F5877DRAFT_55590 [Lentinula edodes]
MYISEWIRDLRTLYPHTREGVPRPNIHAAVHIFDFLVLFGPVISWWCFPFERLIGALQKIKTNDHIGGSMESTIIKSWARTANLRRWLRRPDCPQAITQLQVIFNKCFVPVNAPGVTEEFSKAKGSHRAYAKFDGVNFSGVETHIGNATIFYRSTRSAVPVVGQIQSIENASTSQALRLHVRPYQPLSEASYDPFVQYPYLQATTYSSHLDEVQEIIHLDDVVAHAARYDYSHNRSVFINLSRQ